MNHFNEFVEYVRDQRWMSQDFGTILIDKFSEGQRDAYERGQESIRRRPEVVIPEFTLDTLPRKYVTELKNILRGKIRGQEPFPGDPYINAIKRARELTNAGLKDSKFYIDRLREVL
jgi:hypothetical protein